MHALVARLNAGAVLIAALIVSWLMLGSHAALAQWQPEKNVEIVVPTSTGSGLDTMARTIDRILREKKLIETSMTVVNKAGGGTSIAVAYLAQKSNDGHVLFMNVASVLAAHITGRSKYNYTDFTPLAQLATEPIVFVVRPDSPLKTGRDLIAQLKKDPSSLSIAFSSARGNTAHIAIALMGKASGVDLKRMKTVVFNSAGDGATAVIGGHVDVVVGTPANLVPLMQAGKIRMLAMASAERVGGSLAEVPTWKEQGFDVVATQWRGVLGPKGLTPEQIAFWDSTLEKMTKTPEWKQYLEKNQFPDGYMNSERTRQDLAAQYATVKDVLVDLGLAK